jgi:hypothetical protein
MPEPPRDFADRIDPNATLRSKADGLAALEQMGVRLDGLQSVQEIPEQIRAHLANAERIAEVLAPRGWILLGDAPSDEYVRAIELFEAGRPEEADQLIEDAWNDSEGIRLSSARPASPRFTSRPLPRARLDLRGNSSSLRPSPSIKRVVTRPPSPLSSHRSKAS